MSMIEELKEWRKHDLLYHLDGCRSDLKDDLFNMIQREIKKENGAAMFPPLHDYLFMSPDNDENEKKYEECRAKTKKVLKAILDYCDDDAQKAYDHIEELYYLFRGAANE